MFKVTLLASLFGDFEVLTPGQAAVVILIGLFFLLSALRTSLKYSRRQIRGDTYRRQVSSPYSRSDDRDDDYDVPSGFGGPSGYGVIRASDLEDSGKKPADGD